MRARSWARAHPTAFGAGSAALYLAPHLVPGLDVVLGLFGLTPLGPVLPTLVWDVLIAAAVLALGRGIVTVGSVRGHSWCAWAAAVCCGVVAAVVGGICGTAIVLTLTDAAFASYQGVLASSPAWLTVLTTIAVAPAAEELVFRGSLYRGLRRRWPVLASGFVSAAAFALAHGTMTHVPVTIVLALASSALVERSRSIWPSVALHASANLTTTFIVPMISVPAWLVSAPVAIGLWLAVTLGMVALLVVCASRAERPHEAGIIED